MFFSIATRAADRAIWLIAVGLLLQLTPPEPVPSISENGKIARTTAATCSPSSKCWITTKTTLKTRRPILPRIHWAIRSMVRIRILSRASFRFRWSLWENMRATTCNLLMDRCRGRVGLRVGALLAAMVGGIQRTVLCVGSGLETLMRYVLSFYVYILFYLLCLFLRLFEEK